MFIRIAFVILCFSILIGAAVPRRIYLGYSGEAGSCVFLGWYQTNRFVPSPRLAESDGKGFDAAVRSSLAPFYVGRKVTAVNRNGKQTTLKVFGTDPQPDLGSDSIDARTDRKRHLANVLFSTDALPLQILQAHKSRLTPGIESQLQRRANELWIKHLPERADDERPKGFTLGKPMVEFVADAPDILTISYPMDIEETESHDDRGSMFFIYSIPDRRIVFGEFGHPEWSLGSRVLAIKPKIYFRIGNNPQIFFLGATQGGWEDVGSAAIYELRIGREILSCY